MMLAGWSLGAKRKAAAVDVIDITLLLRQVRIIPKVFM